MPEPLAYFLTWTTHGTWLHGDRRGSVDRHHNARRTPFLPEDQGRSIRDLGRMRSTPVVMAHRARRVVEQTIRDHCDHRGWVLHALNARSNHVHLVVTCGPAVTPEAAMSQFKSWCTRRLREAGHAPQRSKVWTEHGSTRWINTRSSLEAAIDYVQNHQDHS